MAKNKPPTPKRGKAHTVTIRTTRNGSRRDFMADVHGKRNGDTIVARNGMRWKA